jgi:hypothetical protein
VKKRLKIYIFQNNICKPIAVENAAIKLGIYSSIGEFFGAPCTLSKAFDT